MLLFANLLFVLIYLNCILKVSLKDSAMDRYTMLYIAVHDSAYFQSPTDILSDMISFNIDLALTFTLRQCNQKVKTRGNQQPHEQKTVGKQPFYLYQY